MGASRCQVAERATRRCVERSTSVVATALVVTPDVRRTAAVSADQLMMTNNL